MVALDQLTNRLVVVIVCLCVLLPSLLLLLLLLLLPVDHSLRRIFSF
jgi:hypothetical protein